MSGVGKTYWARQLASAGFRLISCDDMIAAHLAVELGRPISFRELNSWLGLPYEPGFEAREAKFLSFEAQTMDAIVNDLKRMNGPAGDLVVDMSGSAVYAGAKVFDALRRSLTIVYLAMTPAVQQQMFKRYARRPRAVVWQGQYRQEVGQTQMEALKACYPRLIAHRERLYETYCDVKLEYVTYHRVNLPAAGFVQLIQAAVEQGVQKHAR
jgi:shikimate kinase